MHLALKIKTQTPTENQWLVGKLQLLSSYGLLLFYPRETQASVRQKLLLTDPN